MQRTLEIVEETPEPKEEEEPPIIDESEPEQTIDTDSVSNWSESAVRSFLISRNLAELLPLFGNINGRELVELYTMCRVDSVSMYRSLKAEMLRVHEKVLTISVYLHFIDRLRTVCDQGLRLDALIPSKHIAESLEDDD